MALVNFITAPFPSGRETSSAMSAVLLPSCPPPPPPLRPLALLGAGEERSGNFFFSVCPSVLRSLVDPEMPTDGVDLQMRSAEVKFTSRCLMPPSLPFYIGRVDEGPACFLIASVEFPCSVIVRV